MTSQIEKLLYTRYKLHLRKFQLIQHLNFNNYVRSARNLRTISVIIHKERKINQSLIYHLHKKDFPEVVTKKLILPLCVCLEEMNLILTKELVFLSRITIFNYSYASLLKVLTGESIFSKQLVKLHSLFDKELVLHQHFFEFMHDIPEKYRIADKKVKSSWKLVLQLQNELHRLGYALGDTVLVKKHGHKTLALISKIQKSEISGFVKKDIMYIKEKVDYIVAHPKENKLAYFLTTVYIVAPFTFETTGVILFFRYLGKYTVSKGKRIGEKFKKKVSQQ